MRASVSRRATAVVAHSYADFPVATGDLDLRGDTSAPLRAATAALQGLAADVVHLTSYGDVAGDLALRAVLGGLFGVDAAHVVVTVGASEALHLALTCVGDPGQRVLLPRPAFPGFDQLAALVGLRPVHYDVPGPPSADEDTPLLVCTPHNPTGVLTRVGDVGARTGWTIWDVSHTSLARDQLDDIRGALTPTGVVVFSLSKLLRLPGARVGALISTDRALIDAVTAVKTHLSMSVDRLAQMLAARVLTDPLTFDELAVRRRGLAALRTMILGAAAGSKTLTAAPAADGTHVLLRTCDGAQAWQRLRAAGVIGLPGDVFNGPPETARVCIAQDPAVVGEAAARMQAL